MKVSNAQLMEIVRKLVKEALKEAGPVGYLSKTKRPDIKTGWDPKAQQQWVAGQPAPGQTPPVPPTGPVGTASTAVNGPPTNLDPSEKTAAGIPSAKSGSSPIGTAQTQTQAPADTQQNSLADVSAMLQNASQDQIAQIMRMLKGS